MKRGSSGSNGGRMKTKYSPRPIKMNPLKARKDEAGESFVFMTTLLLRLGWMVRLDKGSFAGNGFWNFGHVLYPDIGYLRTFLRQRFADLIHKPIICHSITRASEQYDQTVICLLNHPPSTHWNNIHNAVNHERANEYLTSRNGRQREAI